MWYHAESHGEGSRVFVACLDLEGVLVPEIWINVAERTGIDALRRTTRDEPDYDVLMKGRLEILAEHGFSEEEIGALAEAGVLVEQRRK